MITFREEPIDDWASSPTVSAVTGLHFSSASEVGFASERRSVVGIMLGATPALQAEHAKIDLRVSGQGKEATANADQEPPPGGRNDPPVLDVEGEHASHIGIHPDEFVPAPRA